MTLPLPRLSDDQVAEMEAALTEHYGEPVRPVSVYCRAFEQWFDVIRETRDGRREDDPLRTLADGLNAVAFTLPLAIYKSNLLARVIYGGEPLRQTACPEHKGVWSGIGHCDHGCDQTGWIP